MKTRLPWTEEFVNKIEKVIMNKISYAGNPTYDQASRYKKAREDLIKFIEEEMFDTIERQ